MTTDKLEVMIFDTEKYFDIVSKSQLSISEKKVEFLQRYVPKLREVQRNLIEDFEVYFIKEVVTQGYQLQKIDEQDDYL